MNRTALALLAGLAIAVGVAVAGWAVGWVQIAPPVAIAPEPTDHTGHEMAAEPVAEDHSGHDMTAEPAAGIAAMPPGAVMIAPDRQRMIGLRTAQVQSGVLDHEYLPILA